MAAHSTQSSQQALPTPTLSSLQTLETPVLLMYLKNVDIDLAKLTKGSLTTIHLNNGDTLDIHHSGLQKSNDASNVIVKNSKI